MSAHGHMKVEFVVGSDINSCCAEACRLAKLLQFGVEFNFNDVTVLVNEHTLVDTIVATFARVQASDHKYKVACA